MSGQVRGQPHVALKVVSSLDLYVPSPTLQDIRSARYSDLDVSRYTASTRVAYINVTLARDFDMRRNIIKTKPNAERIISAPVLNFLKLNL